MDEPELTPELMLKAYAMGIFPMAEARDDPRVFWVDPQLRGVIPLAGFHISRSLARSLRRTDYQIRINTDFQGVLAACGDRDETWINDTLIALYHDLHHMGHAHSLEVHDASGLVGGVYGLSLGGAFFGESMFSRRRDASKIALAYLVDRLQAGNFTLLDTQFLTPHLASLGGIEIPKQDYLERLDGALRRRADFLCQVGSPTPQDVIQRNTQTS